MKKEDLIICLRLVPSGYGHYKVTYTNPYRKDYYVHVTSNMPLIDAIKGNPDVKLKDLQMLKDEVKREGTHYSKHGVKIEKDYYIIKC